LSRPETRLMTRRVSASFAMVVRECCVWFMTVAAPTSRPCTRGAADVSRTRARAASVAAVDGQWTTQALEPVLHSTMDC